MKVPLSALEAPLSCIAAPALSSFPSLMNVAVPAVLLSPKTIKQPSEASDLLVKKALPAVELSKKKISLPILKKP